MQNKKRISIATIGAIATQRITHKYWLVSVYLEAIIFDDTSPNDFNSIQEREREREELDKFGYVQNHK